MQLGPLNKTEFERVAAILDAANVVFDVRLDDAAAEAELRQARESGIGPAGHGASFVLPQAAGAIYVEFSDEEAFRVAPQLLDLGYSALPSPAPDEEADSWHCPRNDHTADEPGVCPHHKLPLVDFAEHVQLKREAQRSRDFWPPFLMLTLFLGFFVFLFFSWR